VVWNASIAETNKKERASKMSRTEEEIKAVLESIEKGDIESRKERDSVSPLSGQRH
jgi:hypothetical protein